MGQHQDTSSDHYHPDESSSSYSSLPSSNNKNDNEDDDNDDDDRYHTKQRYYRHHDRDRDRDHSSSGGSKHDRHRDICLPPQGRTYLTIGQDLYSIQEYLVEQQNASLHWYMDRMAHNSNHNNNNYYDYSLRMPVPNPDDAVPAAVMVYTELQTLRGLDRPVDYGTGIEYADGALELAMASHHPLRTSSSSSSSSSSTHRDLQVGLQIGLWLNGTAGCHDIVKGKLDRKIHQLVYYLGNTCPANKIFLRIGYEFDNPQFNYASDPQSYQDAFRYIVTKCRKHRACRRRVVMVWHSWAAGLPVMGGDVSPANQSQSPPPPRQLTLDDFYPGDNWVDWVGISVFQQFYHTSSVGPNGFSGGTVKDLGHVLEFAAWHHKPTMIAESTPFGGIHNNSHVAVMEDGYRRSSGKAIWDAWFQPTLQLIRDYDIAMWSYINCNWDAQPFWKGIGFGDTRLSIDTNLMDRWHDHVVSSRRFVRATDNKLCGNVRYDFVDWRDDDSGYDDDDDDYGSNGNGDDDDDSYHSHSKNRGHGKKHGSRHHDYTYADDDYFGRRNDVSSTDHSREHSSGSSSLWGEERAASREGLWNSLLPATMLISSLAILYFMYASTRRSHRRRIQRTPRAQRVRFAFLDAAEDKGDGSVTLYGSIRSIDSDESLRDRRFVRRVGPNLLLSNTEEGSTLLG